VARGVTDADLETKNGQFINPKVFAEKTAAADKVVSLWTRGRFAQPAIAYPEHGGEQSGGVDSAECLRGERFGRKSVGHVTCGPLLAARDAGQWCRHHEQGARTESSVDLLPSGSLRLDQSRRPPAPRAGAADVAEIAPEAVHAEARRAPGRVSAVRDGGQKGRIDHRRPESLQCGPQQPRAIVGDEHGQPNAAGLADPPQAMRLLRPTRSERGPVSSCSMPQTPGYTVLPIENTSAT
jgi:hypothetical protein